MNFSFNLAFRQTSIPVGKELQKFNLPSYQTNTNTSKRKHSSKKKTKNISRPPPQPQAIKPNFRNMFAILASAKSGCGSCSGTR